MSNEEKAYEDMLWALAFIEKAEHVIERDGYKLPPEAQKLLEAARDKLNGVTR